MLNLLGHAEITPVSERTTEVQTAIVAAVGVSSIDDVTETHLAEITLLNLKNKGITELKSGDLSGMTKLDSLNLYGNQLSRLPDGIFDGLTSLTKLRLGRNTVDPMLISVTLERVADNEFKAKVPTGAPFAIVLPVSVTNGTIDDASTTLTIPVGKIYSQSLTVTRTADTTDDIKADIGALPSLPSINHYGYELTKPSSLPILIHRHPSNEFAPVFSDGESTTRSIAENTIAGQNIGTAVVATDENGDTITYSLSGTDAASFDFVSTSGQLQTKVALDYETKSSYSVIITATDTEDESDTISVTINVTNVNEAPAFSSDNLTLSIAENTEPGVNIGSAVTATDDDGDTLTYSLSGTDAASFYILRTTGQIRTDASLDYETKNTYSVTVTATDGDNATATIDVAINVTNVVELGENVAPIFTDGESTTRSIPENISSGVNIGNAVIATDDTNDELTYSINGTDAISFSIESTTGQLKTDASLDYETKSSYSVVVTATDSGELTDSITVTINVTDVNEAPVFASESITRSVAENTDADVNIGSTVSATDDDGDTLTYTFSGDDAASFSIESATGQLKTKVDLDYEDKYVYSVKVTASDGTLTDSVNVTIRVTNVHEEDINNYPEFVEGISTTRSVTENLNSDTAFGERIIAADSDGDGVTYSLSGTDVTSFSIDTDEGQLRTRVQLDYETKNTYAITVTISDGNGGSASIEVTINIIDVLESTPLADRTNAVMLGIQEAISEQQLDTSTGINDTVFSAITSVTVPSSSVSTFKSGDFSGLTSLKSLIIENNLSLTSLPSDIFEGLSSLEGLSLSGNSLLDSLPSGVFDSLEMLETLRLAGNGLSILPSNIFDELTSLEVLNLSSNSLNNLSQAIFQELTQLEELNISTNSILSLQSNLFNGLSQLSTLYIDNNKLSSLPNGVFDGLTSLDSVSILQDGTQLSLSISLEKDQNDQIKASVDTGATFDIVVPIVVTNGSIEQDTSTLTIPTGKLESDNVITVSRTVGTTAAVTVEIGTLPSIPTNHAGYTLSRSSSDEVVVIPATDVTSNSAPVFSAGTSTTRSIVENTAADVNIGSAVSATDADDDSLTYSLGGTDAASFDIDSTNGQLKTKAALDYETKSSYSVNVMVSDGTLTDSINVTIRVTNVHEEDINNNPEFDEGITTTISVRENTDSGTDIGPTLNASDSDSDTVTYSLSGTDATSFSIHSDSGQLSTNAVLDYETKNAYVVTVTISDGNGGSASIDVTINVIDVLESTPLADRTNSVMLGIQESIKELQLDTSMGINDSVLSEITFLEVPSSSVSTFKSGDFSGLTSLSNLIIDNNLSLKSLPSDIFDGLSSLEGLYFSGNNSLENLPSGVFDSLEMLETLRLVGNGLRNLPNNIFDELTSLKVLNLTSNSLNSLSENIFQELTQLEELNLSHNSIRSLGSDIFSGLSQLTTLHIDNNKLSSLPIGVFEGLIALDLFTIRQVGTQTSLSISLEKDQNDQIQASIDTGATFDIEVPVIVTNGSIDQNATTLTIPTGKLKSDNVITVSRTVGTTAAVTVEIGTLPSIPNTHSGYSLSGSSSNEIEVIPATAGPSNSAPVFSEGASTSRSIAENTGADVNIGSGVSATDVDDDTLTYSLGGTDVSSFDIDSTNGQLKTKAALDYETKSSYSVIITVSDGSSTDSITVTINITDIDERPPNNAPVFTDGSTTSRSIAENTETGQNIGTAVSATDDDNNTLTYTLGGTDASSFDVDSTSGQLKTKAALDYETKSSYSVTVTVKDENDASDSINVTINVTDANDAPAFATNSVVRFLVENTPANTNIGSAISATDDDDDTLTYSLGGTDAASFDIDTSDGQLKTKAALDFETKSSYSVTITVSDGSLTDSIVITINITEDGTQSNNPPVFTDGTSTTRSIKEGASAGQNIGEPISATDPDALDTLTYTLGGTNKGAFRIDASTGQLKTKASLDFNRKKKYSVTVTVSDGNSGSATIDVAINILDNAPPAFTENDTTERTLRENTPIGEAIGDPISATDPDAGDILTYTLSGGDVSSFDIDSSSGQLMVNGDFDYEKEKSYRIFITVEDNFNGRDRIIVTVNVEDYFDESTPLSERTEAVSNGILSQIPNVSEAADVKDTHLPKIKNLNLLNASITTLKSGDFSGLTKLQTLVLTSNSFSSLPSDVFDGLTSLVTLSLGHNSLTSLPSDVFDGLTSLETLSLGYTSISSLPSDVFDSLTSLETLNLDYTSISSLPAGIFDGLSSLTTLNLVGNSLSSLPDGIFQALPNLTKFDLRSNSVYPIPVPVSLDKVSDRTFKASIAAVAPVRMVLPITVTNGTIDGDTTSIIIPKGQVQSDSTLTVTRTSGSIGAVSVDIDSFPDIPSGHDGYSFVKSSNLPLDVIDTNNISPSFRDGDSTRRWVNEHSPSGTNIGNPVIATDGGDEGDSVSYTLGGTDASDFDINQETGQLITKSDLDYETKTSYSVTITANDRYGGSDTINVTIRINNINDLVFLEGGSATRSVDENTDSGSNIGDPLTAQYYDDTSVTLTYSLKGRDRNRFDIDSETGQLKTKDDLDFESKSSYSVEVEAKNTEIGSRTINVTINVNDIFEAFPLDQRTEEVEGRILFALDLPLGTTITDTHLTTVTEINLIGHSISSLKEDDFDGLTGLKRLLFRTNSMTYLHEDLFDGLSSLELINFSHNDIEGLHKDTFDGLSSLTEIDFSENDIRSLPEDIFDGLSNLKKINFRANSISDLPEDVFDGLSKLEELDLAANSIPSLHKDVFDGLGNLKVLDLFNNAIPSLPKFVFDELRQLRELNLVFNRLTSLPDDIFVGLTKLETIKLASNTRNPIDIKVDLAKTTSTSIYGVNGKYFVPNLHTGAPFEVTIKTDVSDTGTIIGSKEVTFNTGTDNGNRSIHAVRYAGVTDAVTVDIEELPSIPESHSGYRLVKSDNLPLTVIEDDNAAPTAIDPIPDETDFLPNFPNPFNPETWIPYQLSEASDVTITIYNIRGIVVRNLALGHQKAGFYRDRKSAAHWDGRNALGERVATGVYFVTFKAGDFTATRRMLILK